MKRVISLFVFIVSLFCLFACGQVENATISNIDMSERLISFADENTSTDLAESVSPAIVGVYATTNTTGSIGAGVCVASGGYIMTNSHVVNGASNILLYLFDGTTASARILYEDTVLDFAILKCSQSLPYLAIGDTDATLVGEDVIAVGTPLSLLLTHTFTKGIVSAMNRTLKVSTDSGEAYMQNLIQHDASLNPGNSGGPLLNNKGEVIGINTLKVTSGEGIGFAIPSKSFVSLLQSYINDSNYSIPYLGIYGYDASVANYYDSTINSSGFYIENLAENSVLNEIGITNDCVITQINDTPICNALDLRDSLFKYKIGDKICITYSKDGKTNSGYVILTGNRYIKYVESKNIEYVD